MSLERMEVVEPVLDTEEEDDEDVKDEEDSLDVGLDAVWVEPAEDSGTVTVWVVIDLENTAVWVDTILARTAVCVPAVEVQTLVWVAESFAFPVLQPTHGSVWVATLSVSLRPEIISQFRIKSSSKAFTFVDGSRVLSHIGLMSEFILFGVLETFAISKFKRLLNNGFFWGLHVSLAMGIGRFRMLEISFVLIGLDWA